MNNKDFSTITRTDIGDLIVHWTKSDNSSKNDAFTILQKILDEEKLIGEMVLLKEDTNVSASRKAQYQI